MSMVFHDFSKEEYYGDNLRKKFYASKEFKEMLEQLNVKMEVVDDRVILTGNSLNLDTIEEEFEEFRRNQAQPGKSEQNFEKNVSEKISVNLSVLNTDKLLSRVIKHEEESTKTLDDILGGAHEDTQKEIAQKQKEAQERWQQMTEEERKQEILKKSLKEKEQEEEEDLSMPSRFRRMF